MGEEMQSKEALKSQLDKEFIKKIVVYIIGVISLFLEQ